MKKLFLFALLLGGMTSSRGQGFVLFDNTTSSLQSPPDRLVRFRNATGLDPSFTDGRPVFTNANNIGLRAQLYFGASTAPEGSLVAVSTAPATFRSSTSANVGCWFGGGRTLQGFNLGDTVNLQVRAWDINLASTYAQAEASVLSGNYAGLIGKSFVFVYTIPTIGPPGVETMQNFQGFYVEFVPEPSVVTLAVLGLAAFGFRWVHRRKRSINKITPHEF